MGYSIIGQANKSLEQAKPISTLWLTLEQIIGYIEKYRMWQITKKLTVV